ncbi:peptidylprolyl isomerase, partial [Planctomycetota bacterium]
GKIQEGVDFAEVVKEYSHGFRKSFDGLWQPLDPSSLQDQYQPVIAALATIDVGQVTGVIEGQDRYFIAKLIGREEAHITPFRQVQADIKQILDKKYRDKQLEELLLTRLQEATLGNMEQFINDVGLNVYEQLRANIKENR